LTILKGWNDVSWSQSLLGRNAPQAPQL
jgi:hypothetical protein